jgi:tetratricopeptide (TPR) repeat protein
MHAATVTEQTFTDVMTPQRTAKGGKMAETPSARNAQDAVGGEAVSVQAGIVRRCGFYIPQPERSLLPTPRQVPSDVKHFTGRDAELGKLDALVDDATSSRPSTVVISAIAGSAGIGKTSLAVRWAHRSRWRFPDGQLYVNLRGYDPGPPLTAAQALASLLRSLNLPAEGVTQDVDAMAATYRSLLAGRRMLVVLDNVATPDQIRPLLPNEPGCMVLVTSRNRLSGLVVRDGAHRINLDILTSNEARSLLRDVVGHGRADREPQATIELARLCSNLPLALRIAAERVASRPHLNVADLVRELALEHNRLDALAADDDDTTAVRTVFSWSYHALPAETARMFRLLGLHPGPSISVETAASLADTNAAEAKRQLDALASGHLLAETARERYQFHDLLRAYASECAIVDEPDHRRDASTRRLFEFYLHSAQAALFAYYPQHPKIPVDRPSPDYRQLAFNDRDHARQWFSTEHANLMAIIRNAPAVDQYIVGWQLPNAFDCFLSDHYYVADQIDIHQLGLVAAQHLHDQIGERWANGHLGEAYQRARRYDEAISCHLRALAIAESIGDKFGQAAPLHDLGHAHLKLRHFEEAAGYLRRALVICREIGHRRNEGIGLIALGDTLRGLHQFDEALANAQQGLAVLRTIGAGGTHAGALRSIGMIHHDLQNNDDSIDHLQQAVAMYQDLNMDHSRAETLDDLGVVLHNVGRHHDARDSWRAALRILIDLDPVQATNIHARLDILDPDNLSH